MLMGLVTVVLALSFVVSANSPDASASSAPPSWPMLPPPAGGNNPSIPASPQPDVGTGEPVYTATGDFYFSATDLSVTTYGPPLDFTRTYDSDLSQTEAALGMPGPLGYGCDRELGFVPRVLERSGDRGGARRFADGLRVAEQRQLSRS